MANPRGKRDDVKRKALSQSLKRIRQGRTFDPSVGRPSGMSGRPGFGTPSVRRGNKLPFPTLADQ
jgi:hypothetical protein